MATTPNSIITPQRIHVENGVCTTANTTYTDSPTNAVVIYTAGADGSRVTSITAVPRATVTATQLQLYRDRDGSGTTKRLFKVGAMGAYTFAATTGVTATDFGYSDTKLPLILGPGEKLYAAIGVTLANGIVFNVEGSDY